MVFLSLWVKWRPIQSISLLAIPTGGEVDGEERMTALFVPSVKSVIGKNISVSAQAGSGGGWLSVHRPVLNLELPMFVACVKRRADPSRAPSDVVLVDGAGMNPAACLAACHDLVQSEGRRYAFVKAAGECFCEAAVADDFYGVPEEQCDAECPGVVG